MWMSEKYACLWVSVGVWYENDKRGVFSYRHVVIRLSEAFAGGWETQKWGAAGGGELGTGSLELKER